MHLILLNVSHDCLVNLFRCPVFLGFPGLWGFMLQSIMTRWSSSRLHSRASAQQYLHACYTNLNFCFHMDCGSFKSENTTVSKYKNILWVYLHFFSVTSYLNDIFLTLFLLLKYFFVFLYFLLSTTLCMNPLFFNLTVSVSYAAELGDHHRGRIHFVPQKPAAHINFIQRAAGVLVVQRREQEPSRFTIHK